ncbi:MAG: hypothetical protein ABI266_08800 [Ginsengibacter sp.]
MAKQIKAIECPKCGSTDKTEIKPDYFLCNNCGTEYFLDNDDITVNHNVKYEGDKPSPPVPVDKKKVGYFVIGLALFFLLINILPRLFTKSGNHNSVSRGINADVPKPDRVRWYTSEISYFVNSKDEPILIIAGTRSHDVGKEDGAIVFVDFNTGKQIKEYEIPASKTGKIPEYTIQRFSNGDIFIIEDKMKIYKVDQANYAYTDITASLFSNQPQMSTGVANVEFIFRPDGEGFKLINNEGKNFFYYPIIDKLYTPKENEVVKNKLESKEAGEKLVTVYQFTSKSSAYPEQIRQLIQFTKKDNAGGPDDKPWLEWKRAYPYTNDRKTIFMFGEDLVRNWKDITPGQNYFDPKLYYFDADVLFYISMATPAENAPALLHCLNLHTFKIDWTLKLEDKYIKSVERYDKGYLLINNQHVFSINKEGKVTNEFVKN